MYGRPRFGQLVNLDLYVRAEKVQLGPKNWAKLNLLSRAAPLVSLSASLLAVSKNSVLKIKYWPSALLKAPNQGL